MKPSIRTLPAFLAAARSALAATSPRSSPLTFVVGNESADLDSLCSALLLAYFRSQRVPPSSSSQQPQQQQQRIHIPLCNIPRADLALRPEFLAVLHDADLAPEDVLTLCDVLGNSGSGSSQKQEIAPSIDPKETEWLLVDHNALTGPLAARFGPSTGGGRIIGCIDHHADEGEVPTGAEPRVIEKSGSCSSLVVEHCREAWDALSSSSSSPSSDIAAATVDADMDAKLGRLALAPMLIDTTNLTDAHKTTEHDRRSVRYVLDEKLAPPSAGGGAFDPTDYYERLAGLKHDLSGMSFRDILRKDYKEWTEEAPMTTTTTGTTRRLKLGTSSVPQSFAYLVDRHGVDGDDYKDGGGEKQKQVFLRELDGWAAERELDLVAVLTSFTGTPDIADSAAGGGSGEEFKRELLVWVRTGNGGGGDDSAAAAAAAARRFVDTNGDVLQLSAWRDGSLDCGLEKSEGGGEGLPRWCWSQGKVEHSRKQIAPMLREAMRSVF